MTEIGFTGTQRTMTLAQHTLLVTELETLRAGGADLMVNGCCEGSDRIAWRIWRDLGGRFCLRPGDRGQFRWACDVARDEDMVHSPIGYMPRNDLIAEAPTVVATPREESEIDRSGTWATVRRARRHGSALAIILPSGTVEREAAR